MISRRKALARAAAIACLALGATWFAQAQRLGGAPPVASDPPAVPVAAAPDAADDRGSDREDVKKALGSFATTFQKGDAKALAALWTADGEYIGDDGTVVRGRAALEKDYGAFFAKNPANTLEVEVDSLRFPSRDSAVAEGHFKLRTGAKKELVVSRCSFLFVREGGKWLVAIAREWPGDGRSLRDLEWLIGSWEVKRDTTVVNTRYEWTKNKTFIRCHISITQNGQTQTATQTIGKMPSTGTLHVWTFEDDGGIGDADVTRDGKRWVFAARGSTADGRVVTLTNILTPVDADTFTWQTVERTADGEPLPDLPLVKVTRVKAKP